jgi:hypothetical protein
MLTHNLNIFEDYSVYQVFISELRTIYPELSELSDNDLIVQSGLDPEMLGSPLFFNADGFVKAGPDYPSEYSGLLNFENLETFIPVDTKEYNLQ